MRTELKEENDMMVSGEFQAGNFRYKIITARPEAVSGDVQELFRREAEKHPEAVFFYCDTPAYRKPCWSPDLFLSWDYIGDPVAVREDLLEQAGDPRASCKTAEFYDLKLRLIEAAAGGEGVFPEAGTKKIFRIASPAGFPEQQTPDPEDMAHVLRDFFTRRGISASAVPYADDRLQERACRILFQPDRFPKVSVIIPSKDNYSCLKECVDSIIRLTDYPDYEILVVDNGSGEDQKELIQSYLESTGRSEYLYRPADFNFSRMCNFGAENASGSLLLFLNDDTVVHSGDWMRIMAGQAMMPWTGAVGAHLVYENGTIQHCGVIGLPDGPSHGLVLADDRRDQAFGRNILPYDYLAVTAACLMIEKNKFLEAGGFPEKFRVAYNDVALCSSLLEKGFYNVVRNDVVLTHKESVSRGYDIEDEKKFRELIISRTGLCREHPLWKGDDPFINPGFSGIRTDFHPEYEFPENYEPSYEFSHSVPEPAPYMLANLELVHFGKKYIDLVGWANSRLKWIDSHAGRFVVIETCEGGYVTVPAFPDERSELNLRPKPGRCVGWHAAVDRACIFSPSARVGVLYRLGKKAFFQWTKGRIERPHFTENGIWQIDGSEAGNWKKRKMVIHADRFLVEDGLFQFEGCACFPEDQREYAYYLLIRYGEKNYLVNTDREQRTDIPGESGKFTRTCWAGLRALAVLPEEISGTDAADLGVTVVAEDMESHEMYCGDYL